VLPARTDRGVDEQLVVLEELARDLAADVRILAVDPRRRDDAPPRARPNRL